MNIEGFFYRDVANDKVSLEEQVKFFAFLDNSGAGRYALELLNDRKELSRTAMVFETFGTLVDTLKRYSSSVHQRQEKIKNLLQEYVALEAALVTVFGEHLFEKTTPLHSVSVLGIIEDKETDAVLGAILECKNKLYLVSGDEETLKQLEEKARIYFPGMPIEEKSAHALRIEEAQREPEELDYFADSNIRPTMLQ